MSAFDIHAYTTGASKELCLHSQSIQAIAQEYVARRRQFKKTRLSWRKTNGSRRSLGWIPVNSGTASWKCGQVFHNGKYFCVWDSYGLASHKFRSASFNEDSRGRWYFNVVVEVESTISFGQGAIGIDLGLKDIATTSEGDKLEAGRWYRNAQEQLGIAQRANNKRRAKSIHAKVSNRRKDALHKFSRLMVDSYGEIYIGKVSISKLVKTNMSKSVLDAGWGMLKTMLEYKGAHAGIVVKEVSENFSTQVCSCCGSISLGSPKGRAGLRIREWICTECGAEHDRDVNAARNILGRGRAPLDGGMPAHCGGLCVKSCR